MKYGIVAVAPDGTLISEPWALFESPDEAERYLGDLNEYHREEATSELAPGGNRGEVPARRWSYRVVEVQER